MTQEKLAKKVHLTRTSIVNIEKGRQQIQLHTIVDVARALQVVPAALIPDFDNLEALLRGTPKKGREWIMSSVNESPKKES